MYHTADVKKVADCVKECETGQCSIAVSPASQETYQLDEDETHQLDEDGEMLWSLCR